MPLFARVDSERKIYRSYIVSHTLTLFGEWTLLREWGRVGLPGTVRHRNYEQEEEARKAEQRTIRLRQLERV